MSSLCANLAFLSFQVSGKVLKQLFYFYLTPRPSSSTSTSSSSLSIFSLRPLYGDFFSLSERRNKKWSLGLTFNLVHLSSSSEDVTKISSDPKNSQPVVAAVGVVVVAAAAAVVVVVAAAAAGVVVGD